ncbi:hypothetical protein GVN21_01215 [Caulobacter sp. SLTY]|uniref:hypothetical protein n=1 Tax=Caulobacter sp. SLTY TaxID=2683262 RepID=UPI001412E521|nr:hypothetical protein [Caulobacter sp. SLTY]NBB13970.1 hypothetical protein [Caulobacter sp. SLTY]
MDRNQIHYELFVRRQPASGWVLDLAGEDRARIVEQAEELLAAGVVAAVRVTKESLDPETREFRSVTILNKGAPERSRQKKVIEQREPLCVSPQDLYTLHARERIGRLLDNWLARNRATPFELLHRADLVEKLDASGVELQHAVQKIAVPEAQARGVVVHEIIRTFQSLIERAISRLIKDQRRGAFPDFAKEGLAKAVERLWNEPERAYLLGAGVAGYLAGAPSWKDKIDRLLDLADQTPAEASRRAAALAAIEQPLTEILGGRAGLSDLLGAELDLGDTLAAITRLAGARAVEALIGIEPGVARIMPQLPQAAARLATWLDSGHFETVRAALGGRVLRELVGPKRLKPSDAEAEIACLRGLAMALTAAEGRILQIDDIYAAFSTRSAMMVTSDFVESLLGHERSARGEVEALAHLAENVTGAANKRAAARWLAANISALKFEKDLRYGPDTPPAKLAALAGMQRGLDRLGLPDEDRQALQTKLGDIGGLIEADTKLVALLARANAPVVHRLNLLLRLAIGEAAPLGPAADRAKAEALKLTRAPELREEITRSPQAAEKVRDLLRTAGLAA